MTYGCTPHVINGHIDYSMCNLQNSIVEAVIVFSFLHERLSNKERWDLLLHNITWSFRAARQSPPVPLPMPNIEPTPAPQPPAATSSHTPSPTLALSHSVEALEELVP